MSKDSRFGRKEVRQFAKWLERKGWNLERLDAAGHPIYRWPPTGAELVLPSTPGRDTWKVRLRTEACQAMGLSPHAERPNHRRSRKRVETSGFNMAAVVKENRRRSAEPDLDNATLRLEYEGELDRIRSLAEHPSYQSASEARESLARIRALEESLRMRGIFVHPFDLADLPERSTT